MFGFLDRDLDLFEDADADDISYVERAERIQQMRQWLRDELPWMSTTEVEVMTRQEDFPGFLAGHAQLATYLGKFKRGKTRYVACKVAQRSFTVSARIDLVSGFVYLCENGRYQFTDVDGDLFIDVPVPMSYYPNPRRSNMTTRRFTGLVRNGRLRDLTGSQLQGLVDTLAKAKLLSPL